jgi:hypothetical protein
MSDTVLIDGDQAIFTTSFGAATVVVKPGVLAGSGPMTVNGIKVCVAGDEESASVAGCQYTTPAHATPGTGDLEIASLAADQTATKTLSGGTPVLLVGSVFTAKFTVTSPASQVTPSGTLNDVIPQYVGSGTFDGSNTKFKGV